MTSDDYAWPTPGMTLFKGEADDWRANACMPRTPEWGIYRYGYQLAAQRLMEITSDGEDQDFLIYPILFTARQVVELGLKEVISYAHEYLGLAQDIPQTHGLIQLWRVTEPLLISCDASMQDDAMGAFAKMVTELHQADPKSMTFRYPVDNTLAASFSAPSPQVPSLINTKALSQNLTAMFHYLDGTCDLVENMAETKRDAM